MGSLVTCLGCLLCVSTSEARPLSGQAPTATVSLPEYPANWLHRFILGDLNRDLWGTSFEAPVLSLKDYVGGLTPLKRGGGLQTRSLRLRGGDGAVYVFRSIEKDATRNLDPVLRKSLAAVVLQDQIASLFPMSAMVVSPILTATDVLHSDPVLVVLPDSPALGEFREDFGGLPGWLEARPNEGEDGEPAFAGADRVAGSQAFLGHIEDTPRHRVDESAFLRARLMDLYLGDWDRHPDQWRWAGFDEGRVTRWVPIPRDRDWALNRIDGAFWSVAQRQYPQYVSFDEEYGSVFGTVWNGRALDRLFLTALSWSDWEREIEFIGSQVTDEVIDQAVARLPNPFYERVGPGLARALRQRRSNLPDAAREYYEILAKWSDVSATDEPEFVQVDHDIGGNVRVRITELRRGRVPESAPYFDRTFEPKETAEVRVFLKGGDDSTSVSGTSNRIAIRLVGGGGDDRFSDETTGSDLEVFDDRGDNSFSLGPGATVDASPYEEPEDLASATHQARPRDWGSHWVRIPILGANPDVGAFVGQRLWLERYGFRRFPWQSRLRLRAAVNPINVGVQVGVSWEMNLAPSGRLFWNTDADLDSRDVRHFYDLGNQSPVLGSTEFHRSDRSFVELKTALEYRLERFQISLGPSIRHSRPLGREEVRLINSLQPDGFEGYWQAGLTSKISAWHGEDPENRRSFLGDAVYVPGVLDSEESHLRLDGRASITSSLGPAVLVGYLSGSRVFGSAPYSELPTLGGVSSLRGFQRDRYLGRGAATGGLEIRAPLFPFFVLFPGQLGVSGFTETGRVFAKDELSDRWHPAYGGGLWVSLVRSEYVLSTTLARSAEETRFYFSLGFSR